MTYIVRVEKHGDIFDVLETKDLQDARKEAEWQVNTLPKATRVFIEGFEHPCNLLDEVWINADFYEEIMEEI